MNACEENYSNIYRWKTRRHPEFNEFLSWYEDVSKKNQRRKVWDFSMIDLSPTILKHLYVGDGTWVNDRGQNHISIAMANEKDKEEEVRELFSQAGFEVGNIQKHKNQNGVISMIANFSVETSKDMWNYMGEPLPGFEYKWPAKYYDEKGGE